MEKLDCVAFGVECVWRTIGEGGVLVVVWTEGGRKNWVVSCLAQTTWQAIIVI